ncbi:MAG TPA: hypothetical protein VH814_21105 [Steroidobacteraceae bacterium]|jgi:membrane-bound metal-dependent hydrolase YbcI (DUF457 family)
MFIGHYGVAYAAKSVAPKVSLGAYFLAVQALDVLFSVFVLGGVEHMEIVHNYTRYNPYRLYDMPVTHSLVGSLGWAIAIGIAATVLRVPRRESLWLALAVFSHFVLDVLVHTPDLSIAGDDTARFGLGLWNNVPVVLVLELLVLVAGWMLFTRSKRSDAAFPKQRNRIFLGILVLLTVATPFMPDPASPTVFAIQALVSYGALAWAGAWSVGDL